MIRFNCPVPNGITTTYQHDGLDRLTRPRDASATTTVLDNQYSYNTASQISQRAHAYLIVSADMNSTTDNSDYRPGKRLPEEIVRRRLK